MGNRQVAPSASSGTGALSAAFGRAARRGRRAITDIRASARPGAEAAADSAGAGAVVAAVAEAAVAAVADADRSEGNHDNE